MSLIKKKLTEEELQQVKEIKQQYTNLALSLGELELQKINLERDKEQLLEIQEQLSMKEMSLVKTLNEKYGNGSINIETGEIS
jgi:hypothetical protein